MTREYADLVSTVTETIEQLLTINPMILPDPDQMPPMPFTGAEGQTPAFLFDFEKIIWHYPDAPARLIEE
jgi:hypothetical protein